MTGRFTGAKITESAVWNLSLSLFLSLLCFQTISSDVKKSFASIFFFLFWKRKGTVFFFVFSYIFTSIKRLEKYRFFSCPSQRVFFDFKFAFRWDMLRQKESKSTKEGNFSSLLWKQKKIGKYGLKYSKDKYEHSELNYVLSTILCLQ